MKVYALVSLCVLSLFTHAAFADALPLKEYVNGRFGFSIKYPASLIAGREADNGDGCRFSSKDGEFELVAYAHFLLQDDSGDSIDSRYKEELDELGDTVTYKRKTKTWFVLSGVKKDGTEYYIKFHVKDQNWSQFRISYPHNKSEKYNPWVEVIAKSFVPFLEGDYDRIEQ